MVRSVSGPKFSVKYLGSYQNTLTDGSVTSVSQPSLNYAPTLTNGVSANQVNRAWQGSTTIQSGQQSTFSLRDFAGFDIGGGASRDGLGQELVLEEIVAITIMNTNLVTADGQLEIVAAASEGCSFLGEHTVANGGALHGRGMLTKTQPAEDGFDVDGSSHRITLRAVGGSVVVSIHLFGRSDEEESSSSSSSTSSSSSSSSSSSVSTSSSSISTSSISTSSSSISTSSQSSSSSSSSSMSSSSQSSSSLSS